MLGMRKLEEEVSRVGNNGLRFIERIFRFHFHSKNSLK
jgi:hypothetical protein